MSNALLARSHARVLLPGGLLAKPQSLIAALSLALVAFAVPALAQQDGQSPTGPRAGQAQFISNEQFQAMVQAGTLTPVTYETLLQQYEAQRLANQANRAIVEGFLNQNPDLTDLARLVHTEPDFDHDRDDRGQPRVRRMSNDSYELSLRDNLGDHHTVLTMGQENKFFLLAHSITNLTDTGAQLQLYTDLYNQLPASFCNPTIGNGNNGIAPSDNIGNGGCAGLTPPSALQNADLQTIQIAHQQLIGMTDQIIAHIPIPIQLEPTGCAAEIGASTASGVNTGNWGDMTQSTGCPGPSSNGIYANFNFVNKNLLNCIRNQGQRGTCHIFAATSGIEEIIARDKGINVNLNEQDFQEHVKLLWSPKAPILFNDDGSSWWDITYAASNNYRFAYEKQWDYNPSLFQNETSTAYYNSCTDYPGSEPGCSDTAPQSPEYCTFEFFGGRVCGFLTAALSGSRSPYGTISVNDVWNPMNTNLVFDDIILGLAFNDAVMLGFNVTDAYQGAPGGYIPFNAADQATSVGGHMVHLVGYVSNADLAAKIPSAPPGAGGGYFIIKNSWSACLGDAGYWYMPVSYALAQANEVDLLSGIIE